MSLSDNEVLGLLIYANELDGRHAPNEAKVYAWQEIFQGSAQGMDAAYAKEAIRLHYSRTDDMISPAKIVQAWNHHQRAKREAKIAQSGGLESHCGKAGCPCTHQEPCFKGWLDGDGSVQACPICRAGLSDALARVAPLGERSDHDHASIRLRDWE